jgi:putative ABC transport system ATP-binding protein
LNQHLIEIENLRFRWPGSAAPLLACDSFSLARGEHLFVRGPSGSGKSTLLGLLTGILTPVSGHLSLMQQDTAGLSATRRDRLRADHIGYIFQQFNLVPYLDLVENSTWSKTSYCRAAFRAGAPLTPSARTAVSRQRPSTCYVTCLPRGNWIVKPR